MFLGDLCVDKFHPSAPTADGSPSFNDLLASLSASLRPDDSWFFGPIEDDYRFNSSLAQR